LREDEKENLRGRDARNLYSVEGRSPSFVESRRSNKKLGKLCFFRREESKSLSKIEKGRKESCQRKYSREGKKGLRRAGKRGLPRREKKKKTTKKIGREKSPSCKKSLFYSFGGKEKKYEKACAFLARARGEKKGHINNEKGKAKF